MAGISQIPPLPDLAPVVDDKGKVTSSWREFFRRLTSSINGLVDGVVGDLTFDSLTVSGDITSTRGAISATGGSVSAGTDVAAARHLTVGSNATIGGTLTAGGNTSVGGTLDVAGATTVDSLASTGAISGTDITGDSLDVTGEVEGATLNITGDGDIGGDLDVVGDVGGATATITSNATIGGTLIIDSDTTVKGADDTDAIFNLWADKGDDNADKWRIRASKTSNALYVETYVSGAWVAKFTIDSAGDITVANDIILPADSDKIFVGGGKDASLYYDGTSLYLKTSEVAASDLKLTTGAAKTLELQTVVWDDLRVPLENTRLTPTKSEPEFAAFIDGTYLYGFKATNAADESLHFVAQLPHGYKLGTDLYPHVHWCPSNTDTGNVEWELEYLIANDGSAFGATAATLPKTVAAPGTAFQHSRTAFDAISGSTITSLCTMLVCRLTRRADLGTDTFTGTVWALEFDIHYQIDTIGSRQETTK